MAIRRMISRDPAEFRAFQSRMTTVGKIRLGLFEVPEGRRGRPVKLGTFRLTADNEALIRAVADEYGGEAEQWTPQGAKAPQWQVITDAYALEVYVVNGQNIDPVYEAWAGGRTCVRRCDGEWEQIKQDACLCNGPNRPADTRELCKITVRVQVMLKRIQGLGSWLLESHGENAAMELSTFKDFIANAPMPVPAMLRLRKETRRQWNAEKGKFDTLDFYVPWLDVSVVNAATIAIGGDALTQALSAAGAPAAIGGTTQAAIEARPVSAPVPPAPAAAGISDELRAKILVDIESRTTVEDLEAVKARLIERGVSDRRVKDAWASKLAGVQARDEARAKVAGLESVPEDVTGEAPRPYRVLVTGSRTWTDVEQLREQLDIALMTHRGRVVLVSGACPTGADVLAEAWALERDVPVERHPADWEGQGKSAGFIRNGIMVESRPDIVLSFNRGASKGTEHCTAAAETAGLKVLRFTDDTPIEGRVADRRPCFDPYCANNPATACGFTPQQHMETYGVDTIIEADRAAGRIPDYQVGDTVNVGGSEFTKIREMPSIEDMLFTNPAEPVDGIVEAAPGRVTLPDVPEGDYDADELYMMLMNGAGQQAPPLTTPEVNALIVRATGMQSNRATGHALAQLRAGLKSGAVSWR